MNHEPHELHVKGAEKKQVLYREECYAIQGAVFEVYREMGSGFLEAVYQECTEEEFQTRKIPFLAQSEIPLFFKGRKLKQVYRPDFLCYEKIVVELKAVKDIDGEHRAQIFNYLKATKMRLGLPVNFGHFPKATVERFIL